MADVRIEGELYEVILPVDFDVRDELTRLWRVWERARAIERRAPDPLRRRARRRAERAIDKFLARVLLAPDEVRARLTIDEKVAIVEFFVKRVEAVKGL